MRVPIRMSVAIRKAPCSCTWVDRDEGSALKEVRLLIWLAGRAHSFVAALNGFADCGEGTFEVGTVAAEISSKQPYTVSATLCTSDSNSRILTASVMSCIRKGSWSGDSAQALFVC